MKVLLISLCFVAALQRVASFKPQRVAVMPNVEIEEAFESSGVELPVKDLIVRPSDFGRGKARFNHKNVRGTGQQACNRKCGAAYYKFIKSGCKKKMSKNFQRLFAKSACGSPKCAGTAIAKANNKISQLKMCLFMCGADISKCIGIN